MNRITQQLHITLGLHGRNGVNKQLPHLLSQIHPIVDRIYPVTALFVLGSLIKQQRFYRSRHTGRSMKTSRTGASIEAGTFAPTPKSANTTKPANKYLLFILYCKKPFTSTIPVYITTDKSLPGLLVVSSCCSAFHSRHRDKDDYSGRYRPGRSPDQPKHKYP